MMEIRKQSIFFIGLILAISSGCFLDSGVRPMKYEKDGVNYSCDALFKNGEMEKITCYDLERNILLVDNFQGGKLQDTSILFHRNGEIKRMGLYENGYRIGKWKEYYDNGRLRKVSIHEFIKDGHFEVYNKVYSAEGLLDSVMFNLELKNETGGHVSINEETELEIKLNYSEYDSVHLVILMSYDSISHQFLDTFYSETNEVAIPLRFEEPGEYNISGVMIETDRGEYGGERPFKYKFIVSE